jgi:hypothetical protein
MKLYDALLQITSGHHIEIFGWDGKKVFSGMLDWTKPETLTKKAEKNRSAKWKRPTEELINNYGMWVHSIWAMGKFKIRITIKDTPIGKKELESED